MQLEFLSVTLWDFKEYRGKHKLLISDLGLGVHFVCGQNLVDKSLGSNGASKSTIFDAITWCLYGVTIKGLKGPDIRTWESDTHAVVKLWLHIDGKDHSVKRSTKVNGLELDGKQTTQDAIERLIRLPFSLWGHTVLLGQGEELFLDLKPTAKMNVLSEALALDKWEERSKRAKEHADKFERAGAELERMFATLQSTLEQSNDNLSHAKRQSADWEQERAARTDRRDKELARLTKECERIELERGKYDLLYDGAECELRAAQKLQATLKAQVVDAAAAVSGKAEAVITLRAQIKELESARVGKGGTCPTCGQKILCSASQRAATSHVRPLSKLNIRLDAAQAEMAQMEKASTRLKVKAMAARIDIDAWLERSNQAQDGLTRHTKALADIKGELKALRSQEQDEGENPHAEQLARARKHIKDTKRLIAENEKLHTIADRKHLRARYWVKGFKQVRLYLLTEALDELEGVTAALLSAVGLDAWAIRYEIERETKTGTVSSGLSVSILKPKMSKPVKWESWSGGEAQRLRLVASMALSEMLLRRAGIQCDTIVLDEPTQHLSPEGVRDTVDLLIERGNTMQIFYIDHTAQQSKRFASTIMVTKTTAGASINVT